MIQILANSHFLGSLVLILSSSIPCSNMETPCVLCCSKEEDELIFGKVHRQDQVVVHRNCLVSSAPNRRRKMFVIIPPSLPASSTLARISSRMEMNATAS